MHAEGESPFLSDNEATVAGTKEKSLPSVLAEQIAMDYVDCPINGCGESVMTVELDSHLDMHANANEGSDEEVSEAEISSRISLSQDVSLPASLSSVQELHGGQRPDPSTKTPRHQLHAGSSTQPVDDKQESAKAAWKKMLKMPSPSKHASSTSGAASSWKGPKRLGVSNDL